MQTKNSNIIGILHQFSGMLIVAVLVPYLLLKGFDEQTISYIWAIFPLVGIVSSLFLGELLKKVHASWLLFAALLINASAIPLYLIGEPWSIILARVLDGISFTSITIITLAKLESHTSKERGTKTGMYLLIQQLAKYASPFVGGYLGSVNIHIPFFVTFMALLLLAFVTPHDKISRKSTKKLQVHVLKDFKTFLKKKETQFAGILGFLANGTLIPLRDLFIPFYIVTQFGLNVESVGLALLLYGFTSIFNLVLGKFGEGIGFRQGSGFGLLILGISWLSIGLFATNFITFIFWLLLAGLGNSLWNLSMVSYLGEISQKRAGTNISFYATVSKVGTFIGTAFVGILFGFLSQQQITLTLAIILLGGTILAFLLNRSPSTKAQPL